MVWGPATLSQGGKIASWLQSNPMSMSFVRFSSCAEPLKMSTLHMMQTWCICSSSILIISWFISFVYSQKKYVTWKRPPKGRGKTSTNHQLLCSMLVLPSLLHLKATEVQAQQEEEVPVFPTFLGKKPNWGGRYVMDGMWFQMSWVVYPVYVGGLIDMIDGIVDRPWYNMIA